MGYNTALDLSTELDLESALGMHLRANHYPPVPLTMVQPCIDAIDAYWEDDLNRLIEMPEGVSYRGESHAPAWAVIESHHLDAWCRDDYSDEEM
jgi:hypothetical protein